MSNKIHKCALCKKDFSEDDLINFSLTQDDDNKEVTSYICFGCYVMMHTEIVNHERQEANAGNKNAKKHLDILNGLDKNIQTKIKAKKEDGENISLHKEINQKLINNRPEQLKKYLDKYVVGQDSAKEIMSLAIYNHYKRCLYDTEIKIGALDVSKNDNIPDELQKSNIIVTGPSGSGKTMILKTLAKKLDIPFVVVDASNLTETGYVGSDVDQCIVDLYNLANQNKTKTEYGIVFFDEFDKIGVDSLDIKATLVNIFLKAIEGASFPINRQMRARQVYNTTLASKVCLGAFTEAYKKEKATIGFDSSSPKTEIFDKDLLIQKGYFTNELLTRIQHFIPYTDITDEDKLKIILESKLSAYQMKKERIKSQFGIDIIGDKEFAEGIINKLKSTDKSVRDINNIVSDAFLNIEYEILDTPGKYKTLRLNRDTATNGNFDLK